MRPDGVAEYVENVVGGEGEESPEDEEVGESGTVSEGYALEHLALPEDVGERAEEAADWLVEPVGVFAEQDESEYTKVQNVRCRREGGDGEDVHREPDWDDSEHVAGRDHF